MWKQITFVFNTCLKERKKRTHFNTFFVCLLHSLFGEKTVKWLIWKSLEHSDKNLALFSHLTDLPRKIAKERQPSVHKQTLKIARKIDPQKCRKNAPFCSRCSACFADCCSLELFNEKASLGEECCFDLEVRFRKRFRHILISRSFHVLALCSSRIIVALYVASTHACRILAGLLLLLPPDDEAVTLCLIGLTGLWELSFKLLWLPNFPTWFSHFVPLLMRISVKLEKLRSTGWPL